MSPLQRTLNKEVLRGGVMSGDSCEMQARNPLSDGLDKASPMLGNF